MLGRECPGLADAAAACITAAGWTPPRPAEAGCGPPVPTPLHLPRSPLLTPVHSFDAAPALPRQVGAAAIEIWTMDDGYFFDNIVVSNSAEEAAEVRAKTWAPKKEVEVSWRAGAGAAEAAKCGVRCCLEAGGGSGSGGGGCVTAGCCAGVQLRRQCARRARAAQPSVWSPTQA